MFPFTQAGFIYLSRIFPGPPNRSWREGSQTGILIPLSKFRLSLQRSKRAPPSISQHPALPRDVRNPDEISHSHHLFLRPGDLCAYVTIEVSHRTSFVRSHRKYKMRFPMRSLIFQKSISGLSCQCLVYCRVQDSRPWKIM